MADEDKRIVYQESNGIASIVVPAPEFLASGGTMDDLLKKCFHEDCKDSADSVEIDTGPSDRTFSNAWITKQGKSRDVG